MRLTDTCHSVSQLPLYSNTGVEDTGFYITHTLIVEPELPVLSHHPIHKLTEFSFRTIPIFGPKLLSLEDHSKTAPLIDWKVEEDFLQHLSINHFIAI